MKKNKGIVARSFLFSALLVTVVIAISFTFLYFALPQFYFNQKSADFNKNTTQLVEQLKKSSYDDSVSLIAHFSVLNNATVLSLDKNDQILIDYSSPFIATGLSNPVELVMKSEGESAISTRVIESFTVTEEAPASGMIIRRASPTYPTTDQIYIQENIMDSGVPAEIAITSFAADDRYLSTSILSIKHLVNSEFIDSIEVLGTLQPIDEAKTIILSMLPILLPICIIIGLILSYIYARQISRPILQISKATKNMKSLEKGAISGIRSNDELGELSENLDGLYKTLWDNINSLEIEKDKAKSLEQSKTQFMQSASHELKTPVTALSGILEGMIDSVGVYKDKEKYLVECKLLTDKLGGLVQQILQASKSDQLDEFELELREVNLKEVCSDVLENYQTIIHDKKLNVTVNIKNYSLTTDPLLFSRAFSNLVSNATRYTNPSGKIIISLKDDSLTVENQCDKIDPEELEKLLEPFKTMSYSRDKTKSGTGLGLYIVSKNLEKLGIPFKLESSKLGLKATMFLQ